MNAARQTSYFGEEEKHFLRALLYFDIFNYPLTAEEVARFSRSIMNTSLHQSLESLVSQKMLFRFQDFYSLQDDPQLALRREKGNKLAERKMKVAKRFSRMMSLFPFVRSVMLSGSISKGYMDENSDIDYFIVTEKNRLWIVRTALAVFRRIFLFNSGKNFCTNYFVDNQNLEIKEKNIFTAIELCTLKNMYGGCEIENFRSINQWVFSFLPNTQFEKTETIDEKFLFKKLIENVFSFKLIDKFNTWLMNKTISYWHSRYGGKMDANDFTIAFRSTPGISRSHPQFFQKKVLMRYDQKIKDFEAKNGIDLSL